MVQETEDLPTTGETLGYILTISILISVLTDFLGVEINIIIVGLLSLLCTILLIRYKAITRLKYSIFSFLDGYKNSSKDDKKQ